MRWSILEVISFIRRVGSLFLLEYSSEIYSVFAALPRQPHELAPSHQDMPAALVKVIPPHFGHVIGDIFTLVLTVTPYISHDSIKVSLRQGRYAMSKKGTQVSVQLRQVRKQGGSLVITLPVDFIHRHNIEEGDRLPAITGSILKIVPITEEKDQLEALTIEETKKE
ncbi:hypothetical protein M1O50_04640 [Dehalococcoidia bacterium]|nr:hypothetical protein [Dehalococcoidia bacterium]